MSLINDWLMSRLSDKVKRRAQRDIGANLVYAVTIRRWYGEEAVTVPVRTLWGIRARRFSAYSVQVVDIYGQSVHRVAKPALIHDLDWRRYYESRRYREDVLVATVKEASHELVRRARAAA